MQSTLCFLLTLVVSLASGSRSEGSAVTKVVKLLKDLEAKLEKEDQTAKDLCDKFVCWSTSTIDSKQKAMEEANARVDYLEKYVADIGSGKLTFTMNQEQLTKELESVNATLQNDTATETDRHATAETNEHESSEAIDGLQVAIETLQSAQQTTPASGDKVNGGLVQLRGAVHSGTRLGARARVQKARKLQTALGLGDQYLSRANSLFLRRMLTGQASAGLIHSRKAAVKSSGSASHMAGQDRLRGVIEQLQGIEETFEKDLRDAKRSDLKAFQAYKKRHEAQEATKAALKESLGKLEQEYAARNKAKQESEEEIKSLREQIATDTDIVKDTQGALETKKKECDARLAFRQGELEALGKAMDLLTSDDARDLFNRATSFLQLSSKVAMGRARAAGTLLHSAGNAAKNQRLLILAAQLSAHMRAAKGENPTFDIVYDKIDEMAKAINAEDDKDLKIKTGCEDDLANNEGEKKKLERGMEDEVTSISLADGKINEAESRLQKLAAQEDEVNAQLDSSAKLRDTEAAEYAKSKQDDEDAILLLDKAAQFMVDFYKSQEKASEDGAGSQGSQSQGVIQTMKMVSDDLRKDVLEAEKQETEAIEEYNKAKAKLEAEKAEIEVDMTQHKKAHSDAEEDRNEAVGSKKDLAKVLENLEGTMADVKPNCDFYIQNFEARSKNRATELAGLKQAKGILKGSVM